MGRMGPCVVDNYTNYNIGCHYQVVGENFAVLQWPFLWRSLKLEILLVCRSCTIHATFHILRFFRDQKVNQAYQEMIPVLKWKQDNFCLNMPELLLQLRQLQRPQQDEFQEVLER